MLVYGVLLLFVICVGSLRGFSSCMICGFIVDLVCMLPSGFGFTLVWWFFVL